MSAYITNCCDFEFQGAHLILSFTKLSKYVGESMKSVNELQWLELSKFDFS